jgi:hypothetical protein
LLVFSWTANTQAQIVQFNQKAILYSTNVHGINYRSFRGVPLFNVKNTNNPNAAFYGSDGRAPTVPFPTTNQFRAFLPLGGLVRPGAHVLVHANGTTNYSQNAVNLNLPIGNDSGGHSLVLRAAHAGPSYISRQVSYLFGSIITPPTTDLAGKALTNAVDLAGYWDSEPYSPSGHTNDLYYWSPHARAVFAVQSGPINILWKRSTPFPTQPPTDLASNTNYVLQGGLYYAFTNGFYVVSGSAAKTPKKIYWTEETFGPTGKRINVPTARVKAIKFVYNTSFPQTVTNDYVAPGQSFQVAATNRLHEYRTVWYDSQQGAILAYNQEGRVFMELLGDLTSGDTRKYLGYEVVDVFKSMILQVKESMK